MEKLNRYTRSEIISMIASIEKRFIATYPTNDISWLVNSQLVKKSDGAVVAILSRTYDRIKLSISGGVEVVFYLTPQDDVDDMFVVGVNTFTPLEHIINEL